MSDLLGWSFLANASSGSHFIHLLSHTINSYSFGYIPCSHPHIPKHSSHLSSGNLYHTAQNNPNPNHPASFFSQTHASPSGFTWILPPPHTPQPSWPCVHICSEYYGLIGHNFCPVSNSWSSPVLFIPSLPPFSRPLSLLPHLLSLGKEEEVF